MRKKESKVKDHRTRRRPAARQAWFVVLTVGQEEKHTERKKRGTDHGYLDIDEARRGIFI
jgi:hypothetical protein